ncbi:MAG: signal peptide peptidase SppA [Candidatus Binatia bacterium]
MLQRTLRFGARSFLWGKERLARLCGRRPPYNALHLELSGSLPEESTPSLTAFWRTPDPDFLSVLSLLRWAREDVRLRAVTIALVDLDTGWARLQELRRSLQALRQAGKHVCVFLPEASTREYYLASAADTVVLAPAGHLAITGLAAETMFFKGALDKLGIQAQVSQAGQYKSAGEPFTRESMSVPHREMLDSLLDDLYGQIVDGIATARRQEKENIRRLIDQGLFIAREALAEKLIDHIGYEDELPHLLEKQLGELQFIDVAPYRLRRANELRQQLLRVNPRKVALITVNGPIKRGETVDGPDGPRAVGSSNFIRDLQQARDDHSVSAVVVRVASPGGSGLASDLMWRELQRTRESKPVIISMGDVAASGGYYLALGGDMVFAEEGTVTGSIGVIAGKAVLRDLYTTLGVGKEILTRGKRAALFSDYLAFAPAEQERVDFEIHAFYQDFVEKVAAGRSLTVEAADANAQGRVWSGRQAWARGLVDAMGGVETALAEAKHRIGVAADLPVAVERFPKPLSLWKLPARLRLRPRSHAETFWWTRERFWAILPISLRFF